MRPSGDGVTQKELCMRFVFDLVIYIGFQNLFLFFLIPSEMLNNHHNRVSQLNSNALKCINSMQSHLVFYVYIYTTYCLYSKIYENFSVYCTKTLACWSIKCHKQSHAVFWTAKGDKGLARHLPNQYQKIKLFNCIY